MKFLNNINAKRKLKNLNDSLNQVFLSHDIHDFHNSLNDALKTHHQVQNSLDDSYLFPENDEEKQIFSKNVWLNIDTLNFLNTYSNNIIADTLIHSIGSFYIQNDKHIKMLFANFVLDGLIMAQNHYKDNWKEYISRYFEIQTNITAFIEKNIANNNWHLKPNHPFNFQYPSYYLFTALKEEVENSEKMNITHYDRALVKLAILNKNNINKSKEYLKQAVSLYGMPVVLNGEEHFFTSPLNSILYEDEVDRLKDYSFITNTLEFLDNTNIEDMIGA